MECERCQGRQELFGWNRNYFQGLCHFCNQRAMKIARYREFAKNFRENENSIIDIEFRDVFPVGDEPRQGSFIFNIDGFTIAPFRNNIVGEESPLDECQWFEWGEELYFGPKTFNGHEKYDEYKKYCKKNKIEIPSDPAGLWDLSRYPAWTVEQLRADQQMAFAMTFTSDEFGSADTWIRPWVARDLLPEKPLAMAEFMETYIPYTFYRGWTIGEFERILGLARENMYRTLDYKTEVELETPANIVIATNFEKIANYLEQLDNAAFHEATKPFGHTEEFNIW